MLFDDPQDRCQSEPRSLPNLFGSEEGFKNMPYRRRVHAGTRVADRKSWTYVPG